MWSLQHKLLCAGLLMIGMYHLLVLSGAVSDGLVWGGKLANTSEVFWLEAVSLCIVVVSMIVVWQSAIGNQQKWVTIGLWSISILFLLSAFANLFAQHWIEKAFSIPLALGIGIVSLKLAYKKISK